MSKHLYPLAFAAIVLAVTVGHADGAVPPSPYDPRPVEEWRPWDEVPETGWTAWRLTPWLIGLGLLAVALTGLAASLLGRGKKPRS